MISRSLSFLERFDIPIQCYLPTADLFSSENCWLLKDIPSCCLAIVQPSLSFLFGWGKKSLNFLWKGSNANSPADLCIDRAPGSSPRSSQPFKWCIHHIKWDLPLKPPAEIQYWLRFECVPKADSFHKASWSVMRNAGVLPSKVRNTRWPCRLHLRSRLERLPFREGMLHFENRRKTAICCPYCTANHWSESKENPLRHRASSVQYQLSWPYAT